MNATMKIADWRAARKNTRLSFAKVELSSGMVISDLTALGERGQWASPPSKPMINRDGTLVKDQNGKIRYSPIIEFTSKEVRDLFSSTVVEALRVTHPEVLG